MDISLDNPASFFIRYLTGYLITLPDIWPKHSSKHDKVYYSDTKILYEDSKRQDIHLLSVFDFLEKKLCDKTVPPCQKMLVTNNSRQFHGSL
jgi:hypothetical protein